MTILIFAAVACLLVLTYFDEFGWAEEDDDDCYHS